ARPRAASPQDPCRPGWRRPAASPWIRPPATSTWSSTTPSSRWTFSSDPQPDVGYTGVFQLRGPRVDPFAHEGAMGEPAKKRYSVFLPRTDFPMKADLPQREPKRVERWKAEGIFQRVLAKRKADNAAGLG